MLSVFALYCLYKHGKLSRIKYVCLQSPVPLAHGTSSCPVNHSFLFLCGIWVVKTCIEKCRYLGFYHSCKESGPGKPVCVFSQDPQNCYTYMSVYTCSKNSTPLLALSMIIFPLIDLLISCHCNQNPCAKFFIKLKLILS